MKAEIITIGDEILIGQIVDTNSAWMGRQLNEQGFEVHRIVTIPDTVEAIIEAITIAQERSELILITGGLGPTKDDVTKFALCQHFHTQLVLDRTTLDHISEMFAALNKPMRDAHKLQAMLPESCTPLSNRYGTAAGMLFEYSNGILISMPGVPYEMKGIMTDHVLPLVSHQSTDAIRYRTLVTANVPESLISKQLEDFENELPSHLKLAYLPHYNFVRLRITGRSKNAVTLDIEIDQQIEKIKKILGLIVIADEDKKIQEIVGELLSERNERVTFAESCTGGYVAHLITSIQGSSKYFPGSVVTYSYENKTDVLGVDPEILWKDGAVSASVVSKMCRSARIKNKTNYALSLSGIAGPDGGTADKPVGTVWMAVCDENNVYTKKYSLRGNRIQNIERSAHLGLEMLRKLIVGIPIKTNE